MADGFPDTPEEVRELLEWTRTNRPATPEDIKFSTAAGAPNFLILGYLTEECGIARAVVREQLVAIGWTEALAVIDSWTPEGVQ